MSVHLGAMVRFVKAKASASGSAAAAVKPSEVTELGALMKADPSPLGAVSAIGRVTILFWSTPGVLD